MAREIVDLPIEHSDFPSFFVCLPEGNHLIIGVPHVDQKPISMDFVQIIHGWLSLS